MECVLLALSRTRRMKSSGCASSLLQCDRSAREAGPRHLVRGRIRETPEPGGPAWLAIVAVAETGDGGNPWTWRGSRPQACGPPVLASLCLGPDDLVGVWCFAPAGEEEKESAKESARPTSPDSHGSDPRRERRIKKMLVEIRRRKYHISRRKIIRWRKMARKLSTVRRTCLADAGTVYRSL
jgi:hypothetical protein